MSKNTNTFHTQRELILCNAGELFWIKGYDRTTMRDIAKKCKMTPGNLYNYFKSKECILYQVFYDEVKKLVTLISECRNKTLGDPIERLRTIIMLHCTFTLGDIRRLGLLFDLELKSLSEKNRKKIIEVRDDYEDILRDVIHQGNELGLLDVADEKLATYFISSMISRSRLWYSPNGKYSPDEIAELIFKFTLDGLTGRKQG